MMTPDQWKQLAEFVGLDFISSTEDGCIVHDERDNEGFGDEYREWHPDTDKADFFDVWKMTERHEFGYQPKSAYWVKLMEMDRAFEQAIKSGTDRDIMQAGCLLGAQIGATMNNPARPEIERK